MRCTEGFWAGQRHHCPQADLQSAHRCPGTRGLEVTQLASLEGLLPAGTKKVPKIYTVACHPLRPHLVAIGANCGEGCRLGCLTDMTAPEAGHLLADKRALLPARSTDLPDARRLSAAYLKCHACARACASRQMWVRPNIGAMSWLQGI